MSSIADSRKKRGRPRTGIGEAIGLRLYPDLAAALDAWIAGQPEPQPSRPEAIRRLVERGLAPVPSTANGMQSLRGTILNFIDEFSATGAKDEEDGTPLPWPWWIDDVKALAAKSDGGLKQWLFECVDEHAGYAQVVREGEAREKAEMEARQAKEARKAAREAKRATAASARETKAPKP